MDIWMGAYVSVLVNDVEVNNIPLENQQGRFYGLGNHDAGSVVQFRSVTFAPNFN